MEKIEQAPNLPKPVAAYSLAVKANGLLFVSGQGPWDQKAGRFAIDAPAEVQTRLVIECLKTVLAAAGSSLDKVVRVGVFMKDVTQFSAMNGVYAEYFGGIRPARTTVQAAPPLGISVEMDCIAEI